MKINNKQNRNNEVKGFTLIEMIGVLAIIAILASLLIPKVFQAINDSRVNNAVSTYNSIKAAAAEHYGKWGKFAKSDGTALTSTETNNWDTTVLLAEQRIDKPFAVKIGNGVVGGTTGTRVRAFGIGGLLASTAVTAANGAYDLATPNGTNNISGTYVIEAIIPKVLEQDARDLNDRIDGPTLGDAGGTNHFDYAGKVKYTMAAGEGDVYIYVAHR